MGEWWGEMRIGLHRFEKGTLLQGKGMNLSIHEWYKLIECLPFIMETFDPV